MNMKKLALVGVLALVVIGCVLAAGCTSTSTTESTTTTTSAEPVAGTWTLPDGTAVVFGEDFKGIITSGDKTCNFTWKKNTDGTYQVDREDGTQVIWTLDKVKGIMTNAAGETLTRQVSDASGTINPAIVPSEYIETGDNFVYMYTLHNGTEIYKKMVNGKSKGEYVKVDEGQYLHSSLYDPYNDSILPPTYYTYFNHK